MAPQIDSRLVQNGDTFIAVPCDNVLHNISDAIKNGAANILLDQRTYELVLHKFSQYKDFTVIQDARRCASRMFRQAYPLQPDNVAVVTGTNGKTSVVKFLEHIWMHCGYMAGSIGTLGITHNKAIVQTTRNTTPGPEILYKELQDMVANKVTHVAMEGSSHAISQHRFDHVAIDLMGFTNITQDHMSYHKTLESYIETKMSLLELLGGDKYCSVNIDDNVLYESIKQKHAKVIAFGYNTMADISASNVVQKYTGVAFDLSIIGQVSHIDIPLVGEYNVRNIMCAASLAIANGCKTDDVFEAISMIHEKIPGRSEEVVTHNGGKVFVDFCHNGDGFRSCLESFRAICGNRLICVFGVSDKDYVSRCPAITDQVNRYCDHVVVTDDNLMDVSKRDVIRDLIISRIPHEKYEYIQDRKLAIEHCIDILRPGDILVVAGRGHEPIQTLGTRRIDLMDKDVILDHINNIKTSNKSLCGHI